MISLIRSFRCHLSPAVVLVLTALVFPSMEASALSLSFSDDSGNGVTGIVNLSSPLSTDQLTASGSYLKVKSTTFDISGLSWKGSALYIDQRVDTAHYSLFLSYSSDSSYPQAYDREPSAGPSVTGQGRWLEAVPDSSSTVLMLSLSLAALGVMKWRLKPAAC